MAMLERNSSSILSSFFIFLLLLQRPVFAAKQPYIVYLGGHPHDAKEAPLEVYERVTESHYDLLGSLLGDNQKAQDAIFYSYTKSINGFAANLEEDEAMEISKHPGVVSVFPSRSYELHTTRSWNFLGLERNSGVPKESLWARSGYGENIIIGNLDSGVWPEAPSFEDYGMGPIPSKWKGICQNDSGQRFSCNRKLIGARYFHKGYQSSIGPLDTSSNSPWDSDGHGTHTLSTAGGKFVPGANIFGYGRGTAKGGAPRARVAAYKVCWLRRNLTDCLDTDILAAFDAAIHDGVDVLSVSLGSLPSDYFSDGIAIGSFHAVMNGITVVSSAGNSGPEMGSVSNVAPWMLTVGASTIDREFTSYVKLNRNIILKGESLSPKFLPERKFYPIIKADKAKVANASIAVGELCIPGKLDPAKVKGKIVACVRGFNDRVEKGSAVLQAGGVGMILANDEPNGNEVLADAHVLPATHISYSDGLKLFAYLNSSKNPLGYITKPETRLGIRPAPIMAAFSSQGPNQINNEILKPDITAPGVSIIAAYTGAAADADNSRRVAFHAESGTSMACPHISGVVGLLKKVYPQWSPAAIKSAIMTTASTLDNTGKPIKDRSLRIATPFNYGSGHVRPNNAIDPGLVYDLTSVDYLNFLCGIGYNKSNNMKAFINGTRFSCPSQPPKPQDLNYPSISVPNLSPSSPVTVTRRVKNVGVPATYVVRVKEPRGVSVSVSPKRLTFVKVGEEKMYQVKLQSKRWGRVLDYVFGELIWSDGKHFVRTPVVVRSS